jgi:predicted transcriptional regulator
MPSIDISDELERKLKAVAQEAGKSRDDMAQEILGNGLEELDGSNIIHTPEEIERMKHSLAQLDRGEFVTGEEVEQMLDSWLAELDAREIAGK